MVVPASQRIAKYTAKYDPALIEMRLIAMKDIALQKIGYAYNDIAAMELAAQVVLNTQGVITNDRPKYYNYCREIWKAVRNGVTDPSLTAMVVNELGPKYEALGCVAATLIELALTVFSIVLPP